MLRLRGRRTMRTMENRSCRNGIEGRGCTVLYTRDNAEWGVVEREGADR
jgi:hypothetical protein